jgi:threonine/homoserine/homoserine lactone efflux protein
VTLSILLALISIHLVAIITPGANFLVVTQTALTYSRRTGLLTVVGVATASLIYVTAGIIGFAALISQSALAYNLIRVVGAAYFVYMAYGLLTRKPRFKDAVYVDFDAVDLNQTQAYRRGLATGFANPASALYFLSIFTTFIPPASPMIDKALIGLMLVGISLVWYALVALTFNNRYVRWVYRRGELWMNRIFGVVWLGLALKLLAG